MTTMINAKRVIDLCKNYYDIIGERYTKDDILTKEILNHYKYIIENTNVDEELDLNRAINFDESVYAYFNDKKFNEIILKEIMVVAKGTDLVEFMISKFEQYKNDPTNKVTTTKWI